MRTRQQVLADLAAVQQRQTQLKTESDKLIGTLTGWRGTAVGGILTVGGIAASWATFGISLAASLVGAAWFSKETVDKVKARKKLKKINDELSSLAVRSQALQAELASAP